MGPFLTKYLSIRHLHKLKIVENSSCNLKKFCYITLMKTIKEWMKKFTSWEFYIDDWDKGCIARCEIEGRLKEVQDDAYKAGFQEGYEACLKINGGK